MHYREQSLASTSLPGLLKKRGSVAGGNMHQQKSNLTSQVGKFKTAIIPIGNPDIRTWSPYFDVGFNTAGRRRGCSTASALNPPKSSDSASVIPAGHSAAIEPMQALR